MSGRQTDRGVNTSCMIIFGALQTNTEKTCLLIDWYYLVFDGLWVRISLRKRTYPLFLTYSVGKNLWYFCPTVWLCISVFFGLNLHILILGLTDAVEFVLHSSSSSVWHYNPL